VLIPPEVYCYRSAVLAGAYRCSGLVQFMLQGESLSVYRNEATPEVAFWNCEETFPFSPTYQVPIGLSVHILRRQLKYTVIFPGPPLWSSGQRSWLQIKRSGFDSRHYQIFWEVVGLERGLLSLVSAIKELLGRKNSCYGLIRDYGRSDPPRWPHTSFADKRRSLCRYSSLAD
jgi:hypothetical protein